MAEAKISSVAYNAPGWLCVWINDGRLLYVPISWYPRLEVGTEEELANWELNGEGEGVHWPDLDEDISLQNLLEGKASTESQRSFEKWIKEREEKTS